MLDSELIRKTVTEPGKQYGVEKVYLFGSYARGEANEASDVDLRIDKGKIRGLFRLSGFRLALEDRLGTDEVLLYNEG